MENKTILAIKDLAMEYIKENGCSYTEAIKKATRDIRERDNWKYGIYN